MINYLQKIIEKIESAPMNFSRWLLFFLSLVIGRLLIESWLEGFKNKEVSEFFFEFTHAFLFFLLTYLLFLRILKKFLKIDIQKIAKVLIWGFLLILFPPIIDRLISRGEEFWIFYKFDSLQGLLERFFTFFGNNPDIGITYGVRIEIAIALLFLFAYGLIKSRNIVKSLNLLITSYVIFFFLGTLPSWIAIITKGFFRGFVAIGENDIAEMFFSPLKLFNSEIFDPITVLNIRMSLIYALLIMTVILVGLFIYYKERFIGLAKNARFPQLIYHSGLLIIGLGLGLIYTENQISFDLFNALGFLVLFAAVYCAWIASVIVNDIADQKIDRISNPGRPLTQEIFTIRQYKTLGWIFFSASILFSALVSVKIALLILVYQIIAWFYSSWPLRLKRFTYISTFISSVNSLIILIAGYIIVSPEQNIENLPFPIIALLLIGGTLTLPVKDLKDLESDKKEGVYSVPVLFGEYWGKVIIASGILFSFLSSVILFNEPRLFWWAATLGGISFWIVVNSQNEKQRNTISYRELPWWIVGLITIYLLIITFFILL